MENTQRIKKRGRKISAAPQDPATEETGVVAAGGENLARTYEARAKTDAFNVLQIDIESIVNRPKGLGNTACLQLPIGSKVFTRATQKAKTSSLTGADNGISNLYAKHFGVQRNQSGIRIRFHLALFAIRPGLAGHVFADRGLANLTALRNAGLRPARLLQFLDKGACGFDVHLAIMPKGIRLSSPKDYVSRIQCGL